MLLGDNGLVSIVHIEYIRLDLVVPFKYTIPRRRFDNRRLRGTIPFSFASDSPRSFFSSSK